VVCCGVLCVLLHQVEAAGEALALLEAEITPIRRALGEAGGSRVGVTGMGFAVDSCPVVLWALGLLEAGITPIRRALGEAGGSGVLWAGVWGRGFVFCYEHGLGLTACINS
jgi:hypothetical protein